MPATALTSTTLNRSAATAVSSGGSAVDQANGNSFVNTGDTLILVRTTGTATTPSISYAITADGATITARSLGATGATATTVYGPFPVATYGSNPTLSWSSGTGATVMVLEPTN